MLQLTALALACSALCVAASPTFLQQEQNVLQHVNQHQIDPEHPFARRLISLAEGHSQWMTEEEIFGLYRSHTKFVDVTDGDMDFIASQAAFRTAATKDFPKKMTHKDAVDPILATISTSDMESFLTTLSGFHTRYFQSTTGAESAKWIFDQVQDLADKIDRPEVSLGVTMFEHSWGQPSVIARFEATNSTAKDIVVISAHQDSVNQWNPWFGRSPGADDDGSGTTTIFETLRRLVHSSFVPHRAIEFHWYAAEEGGLLGSQKVVASYVKNKIDVFANFHNDMTGYQPEGKKPVVGISTDFVDPKLSKVLELVTETYSTIPWVHTKCGYACSDHASWTKAGVPAVFTFEAPFGDSSPFIHTTDDTVEHIDFEHMSEFVKGVIGFAVEMSLFAAKDKN
eukprot:jgi/Hompol1/3639/HPOL_000271-RA